jgi:HPr kinase/phosphorylase
MRTAATRAILHATAVAVDGRGLLITGAAGAGKSSLAVALIGLGAHLVSDDQTVLERIGDRVVLDCPVPDLRGVIEVREMGLLRAPVAVQADLALVVDLDAAETQRLPPTRMIDLLGCSFPLVRNPNHAHFPVALMLQLRHGRHA